MGVCALVVQQADMSALRLLEALLVSLPQTLLQTYILLSSDQGLCSPGEWSVEMSVIHAIAGRANYVPGANSLSLMRP